MKRSDMVDIIAQNLEHCDRHGALDREHYLRAAHRVLESIEIFGMLPPMLPIPEYAFQADHAWEPEDESL